MTTLGILTSPLWFEQQLIDSFSSVDLFSCITIPTPFPFLLWFSGAQSKANQLTARKRLDHLSVKRCNRSRASCNSLSFDHFTKIVYFAWKNKFPGGLQTDHSSSSEITLWYSSRWNINKSLYEKVNLVPDFEPSQTCCLSLKNDAWKSNGNRTFETMWKWNDGGKCPLIDSENTYRQRKFKFNHIIV